MRTKISRLACLPLFLALTSPGWCQLDLDPVEDGTLYEDFFGDLANGAGGQAFVGDNASNEIRRAVLRFDFSMAPPGQRVSKATLEFSVDRMSPSGPSSRPMGIHRLHTPWTTGDSDAGDPGGGGEQPEFGDATWIHSSYPGSFWGTLGGDFDPVMTTGVTINSMTRYSISNVDLRDDVQNWIDNPGQNHGWLFKMNDEGSNSVVRIGTSENMDFALRPKLILEFNTFTSFCSPADPNSTGLPTRLIGGFGSGSGSDLHLEGYDGPPSQFGYILVGTGFAEPGISLGSGHLCLTTTVGRYNVAETSMISVGAFDATGRLINLSGTSTASTGFDVPTTVPIPGNPTIMAGDLWHFQLWHREDNGDSNLSNGLSVQF